MHLRRVRVGFVPFGQKLSEGGAVASGLRREVLKALNPVRRQTLDRVLKGETRGQTVH